MFHDILVPLDGSLLAECALPHVVAVARACEASITFLHVVECPPSNSTSEPIDPLAWQVRKVEAQAYLDELRQRLQAIALPIDTVLLEGRPAPQIIKYVQDQSFDLIALSSHGEGGMSHWNISNIVHKVVQRANISALVIRAYRHREGSLTDLRYQRLLAPLDGSPRAEYAIGSAAKLAQAYGAQLLLAHVIVKPELFPHVPPQQDYLELANHLLEYNQREAIHYLERVQARLGKDVTTRIVVSDDIAVRLHQLIAEEEIDLIVVSAHGKSGKPHWPFGSVSANLILYGTAPILIVQDLTAEEIEPTHAERFAREYPGH